MSQHQVDHLQTLFDGLHLDPKLIDRDREVPLERLGGFLALRTPRAGEFQAALAAAGVATDHRGGVLRFGPAPYLGGGQIDEAMAVLGAVSRSLAQPP